MRTRNNPSSKPSRRSSSRHFSSKKPATGAAGAAAPRQGATVEEDRLRDLPGQIQALLAERVDQPLSADEMAQALSVRGAAVNEFGKLLNRMVMNGDIVVIRKNRYALGSVADLVTGCMETRFGDGFVVSADGRTSVRIRGGRMDVALPGDRVVVRMDPPDRLPKSGIQRREGQVIRILERGRRVIVGTLRTTGAFHYVVPMNPGYQQDFYVKDVKNAQVNDRVVVQFIDWANRHVNPEGEIIEVLGPVENPSLDTLAVIRHYNLAVEFPEDVVREAETAIARMEQPGQRLDLRDKFIFTVDPDTARDFDDALSLETDAQGRRVLGVHIADVSHFVAPGTALDREAILRGNSVYLPDRVLPMLPEHLSNGLCSLNPNQDRLAFSVILTLDDTGRPVASKFGKSIIRSKLRLTYEQALALIQTRPGMRSPVDGVGPEVVALIHRLHALAQQIRGRRFAQYALDLDLPESKVVIGPSGLIEDIRRVENDFSHQMIEECMVAANEAVDRFLSGRNLPLIHRLHEDPAPERMNELAEDLRQLGFRPGDLRQRRHLAEFVLSIREAPLGEDAQMLVLRSMKRAIYSAEKGGHYGLAKKYYAHFTSPIRRYPDLIVHRILEATLKEERQPYSVAELKNLAQHCTHTEEIATQAERDIIEIKKYRFLAQQVERKKPESYDAVIVRASNFGFFVRLFRLEVEGLVHVSTLSERFVRFDPAAHALRVGSRVFATGTRVKVHVVKVDFEQRRLDFALDEERTETTPATAVPERPQHRSQRASHRPQRRGRRG
jgi:ribonuclease R